MWLKAISLVCNSIACLRYAGTFWLIYAALCTVAKFDLQKNFSNLQANIMRWTDISTILAGSGVRIKS